MKVIIIGAGVGGLAAAIGLRRAGLDVRVFERARQMREGGTALTLWTNAIKAAEKLGLAAEIRLAGTIVTHAEVRTSKGAVLVRTPLEEIARTLGAPTVCIDRSKLLAILERAVPSGVLGLGAPCTGFEMRDGRIAAKLADGVVEIGDVLVGADGLHSAIRDQVLGPAEPEYRGYTSWRAITQFPGSDVPVGHALEAWGAGARFGIVALDGERTYWFAKANSAAGGKDDDPLPHLTALFSAWHQPIPALIAATPASAIIRYDIVDRDPVGTWGTGPVTLLGDAAHPSTPDLGQGACMAIEDAVVLARCLKGAPDAVAALRRYETLRMPRTARVVHASRKMARMGQMSSPLLCGLRNLYVRLVPTRWLLRDFVANLADDSGAAP